MKTRMIPFEDFGTNFKINSILCPITRYEVWNYGKKQDTKIYSFDDKNNLLFKTDKSFQHENLEIRAVSKGEQYNSFEIKVEVIWCLEKETIYTNIANEQSTYKSSLSVELELQPTKVYKVSAFTNQT